METVDYEWLADLHKSQCFTTSEVSNPAKSSDFGADGYTGSLTDWHELLQITAPDRICGVVFVRGDFPNLAESVLARAQRRDDNDNKGCFGTNLQRGEIETDLECGERRAQGWINFRWPYTAYELKRLYDYGSEDSGTYEEISFVRNGIVFNIARIKWGHGSSISSYDGDSEHAQRLTVKIKTGGILQFGCPCAIGGPQKGSGSDTFDLCEGEGKGISCVSERYKKRLDINMLINGAQQDVRAPLQGHTRDEVAGKEVDLSSIHRIELSFGEPTYLVSTYSLRNVDEAPIKTDGPGFFDGLEDYLGTCNTSVNMLDRLWTGLCSANYDAGEAVEMCVIGRCVEQIVSVAAIPIQISEDSQISDAHSEAGYVSAREMCNEAPEKVEIALLCNLVTPQYVDVQSAFFQIRLVVKAYEFIRTRHFEPDLLDSWRSLDNIRDVYLERLRHFIRSSLMWLVNTDMKPHRLLLAIESSKIYDDTDAESSPRVQECESNRVLMDYDQSYNQACYATLAVWYIMHFCPHALTETFKTTVVLPKLKRAYDVVSKRASRDKEPTPKNDVLQWLHLCCLFLICDSQFHIPRKTETVDGFTASGLDRHDVLRAQQRFETYVSRLKNTQIESYSIEHEELDRVLLLCEGLGLEGVHTANTFNLATSRSRQLRKRILERKRTTRFNPGPKFWKGSRITSNGPWELHCTNHETYLRVADDANIKDARDRLFEFMAADYSFMSCWDRANAGMIGKWWDLEPASVVCATLIDLKLEGKLRSAVSESVVESMTHSTNDFHTSPVTPGGITIPIEEQSQELSIKQILQQIKQIQEESKRDRFSQMRQLLAQEEAGASLSVKAFDWMISKPGRIYHPSWWIQSLCDTPEFYLRQQTKDVPLRKEIRRYLQTRERADIIKAPEYTPTNIERWVKAKDLQFLSVFDFHLNPQFAFVVEETTLQSTVPKSSPNVPNGEGYISGHSRSASNVKKQSSTSYNSNQLERHRKAVFAKLNDSLVDLGTKHRILFAEKCSPALVGSFIYMWHPDALDTIDSYFGSTSRFVESRESLMWTSSITISHWSIRPTSHSQAHHDLFTENRSGGDFPPASIARLDSSYSHVMISHSSLPVKPIDIIEERCSSLVVTGDALGYNWICSIWSSLTDSEEVSGPISFLPKVLQKFVHQQACARCLVFLVLLGHMCEKLAVEYEDILGKLDIIVGLGQQVLLEGLEWGTSEAVDKLKKMLWGLEALRVFDDRLSSSLGQIQKAQEAMEKAVKQEAGQQHIDLLQDYNNVIEEFEKRYGMLSDVQIRTQLKIRQVTGLRDGISTVTNVEDSQTALRDSKTTIRQGNNIRILTYITIAYLPLGFVTGLFSISNAPFMTNAGDVAFAILTVVFVLGTYALALSLESIIDRWSLLREAGKKRKSEWRATPITSFEREKAGKSWLRDWGCLRRLRLSNGATAAEEFKSV